MKSYKMYYIDELEVKEKEFEAEPSRDAGSIKNLPISSKAKHNVYCAGNKINRLDFGSTEDEWLVFDSEHDIDYVEKIMEDRLSGKILKQIEMHKYRKKQCDYFISLLRERLNKLLIGGEK